MIGRAKGTSLRDAAKHLIAASARPGREAYIALVREKAGENAALLSDDDVERLWELYRQGLVGLPA